MRGSLLLAMTPRGINCAMDAPDSRLPPLRHPTRRRMKTLAASLLADAERDPPPRAASSPRPPARRGDPRRLSGLGGVEEFLHAYSLSTKEGLALMVLAEALLRVPDAATADRLIEDKLAAGRWLDGDVKSTALLVSASAWTLGIAARVIHPGETPQTILDTIVRRLGLPAMRAATRQAMRLLGSHFVIGQDIDAALARAAQPCRLPLFLRHARRGRAHRSRRGKIFRRLCDGDRGDRRTQPGTQRCRAGPAFRSSCRRCIRATRRSRAIACSPS